MVTLKDWFQEKDYGIGLAILGKYCKNRTLLQNLGRKKMPAKLEHELNKVAKLQGLIEKESPAKKPAAKKQAAAESHSDQVIHKMNAEPGSQRLKIVRNNTEVKYEDLPEEIQKLWDTNRDAYKQIRALHEKLKLMGKAAPEDRVPLLELIDELDGSIRGNWEIIDAWHPGDEALPELVPIDHKRINSNRKYISTNLKKLAAETDEKKAAVLQSKIQHRVTELKAAGEEMTEKTKLELKALAIEC